MILVSSMSRIKTFLQSIMCLALCCQLGNLQDCKVPKGWKGANCLGHFYHQRPDHLTNAKGSFFNILLKSPVLCSVAQSWLTSWDPMDCSPPGLYPWDSPGKNTGMGCHDLLQGIFPTQGSNPRLQHGQADSVTNEPSGKTLT